MLGLSQAKARPREVSVSRFQEIHLNAAKSMEEEIERTSQRETREGLEP
jgi:hypothetical protein